jgi:hypothetical protein
MSANAAKAFRNIVLNAGFPIFETATKANQRLNIARFELILANEA